jgi:hypothetical protein
MAMPRLLMQVQHLQNAAARKTYYNLPMEQLHAPVLGAYTGSELIERPDSSEQPFEGLTKRAVAW